MSTKFSCLVTLVLACLVLQATSDDAQDVQECTSSLVGLATCLPYVGGTARSPTPDCCTGLKQVLQTSKKCLCVVIKDRNDPNLGLQINITLALGLPATCKTPADLSDCPALLKLAPNSPEAQIFYQLNTNSSAPAPSPVPMVTGTPPGSASARGGGGGGGIGGIPRGPGSTTGTGSSNNSSYARKRGIAQHLLTAVLLSCLFL